MLYRWKDSPLLAQAELLPGRKHPEAVLTVNDKADPQALAALNQALIRQGYLTLPDNEGGRTALRVQHIASKEKLLADLAALGAVSGYADVGPSAHDKAMHLTKWEKVEEYSKPIAGAGFFAGDIGMATAGFIRHDWAEALTGLGWGSTGFVLLAYGKKHPDTQTAALYKGLVDHLQKKGIDIPAGYDDWADALKAKDGVKTGFNQFCYGNAADIHHAIQAVGALTLVKAGINQNNHFKTAAGALCSTGQVFGLLPEPEAQPKAARKDADGNPIAESPEEKEKDKEYKLQHSFTHHPMQWFKDKPMRAAGILPFLNNLSIWTGAELLEKPRLDDKKQRYPKEIPALEKIVDRRRDYISGLNQRKEKLYETLHDLTRERAGTFESDALKILDAKIHKQQSLIEKFPAQSEKAFANFDRMRASLEEKRSELAKIRKNVVFGLEPYQLNKMTAVAYMGSNLMYSLGSKNEGAQLDATGAIDDLTAFAAGIVMHQPQGKRAEVTNDIASWLAARKDIPHSAEELTGTIDKRVAALTAANPWVERVRMPAAAKSWSDRVVPANRNGVESGAAIA